MTKKGYSILFLFFLLVGCGGKVSGETGPYVALESGSEAIEVALTLTTEGALKVVGSYAHTLVSSGPLRMGWEAAVEYVIRESNHRHYTLYIVYREPNGEVYQEVYDIGKPFRVTFTEHEHVEVIESSATGSIVVTVGVQPLEETMPYDNGQDVNSPQLNTIFPTATTDAPAEDSEAKPENACANSPKRLNVGREAEVCTYNSREPVRIRNGPGIWYSYEHELRTGAVVDVIGGPVCDEDSGWWYWKIETQTRHYRGWMAEGGDEKDLYFLCPYP